MKRTFCLFLLMIAAAGCAGNKTALRTARAQPDEMALLCKHCNCTMPADVDLESKCTVCNCGYRAGKCYRGR